MSCPPTYVLHPGKVVFRDGSSTYVGVSQLRALYRVPRNACRIYPGAADSAMGHAWIDPPGAIHLHPRSDGNYELPIPA